MISAVPYTDPFVSLRPQDVYFQALYHRDRYSTVIEWEPSVFQAAGRLPPFSHLAATLRYMLPVGAAPLDALAHVIAWRLTWRVEGFNEALDEWRATFPPEVQVRVDLWLAHLGQLDSWTNARAAKIDVLNEELQARISRFKVSMTSDDDWGREVRLRDIGDGIARIVASAFNLLSCSTVVLRNGQREIYDMRAFPPDAARLAWEQPL